MSSLTESSAVEREAWRSLAHRSRSGLLGFPLIFCVLGLSVLDGHAPGWFINLMSVVLLVTAFRGWLAFRFDSLFDAAPRLWRAAYMIDLTVLLGLLAVVICHILVVGGLTPPGFLALAAALVTAGFGVIVYSYHLAIARFVIALIMLPVMVVLVQAPEPRDWPGSSLAGLGVIAFVLYLLSVTRQLHVERACDEGRSGPVPESRHERLHHQAVPFGHAPEGLGALATQGPYPALPWGCPKLGSPTHVPHPLREALVDGAAEGFEGSEVGRLLGHQGDVDDRLLAREE